MLRALSAVIRQLSIFDAPASLVAEEPYSGIAPPGASSGAPSSGSFQALCTGPYAHIRIEFGNRLRDSWKVTWTRFRESLLLRLPSSMADAPEEVKLAALQWALLVSRRSRRMAADSRTRETRTALESAIRAYLEAGPEKGSRRESLLAGNRRRIARLRTRGENHDLEEILQEINARYFQGTLQARITWASRLGGLSTHRLAEDGEGRPYHLLTISRGYDAPEVTPEILGGVVYHECLHIAIPPRREGGRRIVHGRDFRLRERQYEHYQAWRKWHREGLPRVLRRMMRARKG